MHKKHFSYFCLRLQISLSSSSCCCCCLSILGLDTKHKEQNRTTVFFVCVCNGCVFSPKVDCCTPWSVCFYCSSVWISLTKDCGPSKAFTLFIFYIKYNPEQHKYEKMEATMSWHTLLWHTHTHTHIHQHPGHNYTHFLPHMHPAAHGNKKIKTHHHGLKS